MGDIFGFSLTSSWYFGIKFECRTIHKRAESSPGIKRRCREIPIVYCRITEVVPQINTFASGNLSY